MMPTIHRQDLLDVAGSVIETACPDSFFADHFQTSVYDQASSDRTMEFGSLLSDPVAGWPVIFLGAMALIVIGFALLLAFSFRYARWCLGCLLVRSGKVKHSAVGRVRPEAWLLTPFEQTIWPAFAMLLHVAFLGALLPRLTVI